MMKLTSKHAAIRCGLLVVSSTLMSGCFELNYPDIETLYKTLGTNVEIIKTDQNGLTSSSESISIEEKLLNDDSVNDMKNAPMLDPEYYEYISIKFTEGMDIGDFALFIKSEQSVEFKIRTYIVDQAPIAESVRAFKLPQAAENIYSDGFSNVVGEMSITITEYVWSSFYLNSWLGENESKSVRIEKNQYFIIQFLNNTGYGADIGLGQAKFIPVNLMISPLKGI